MGIHEDARQGTLVGDRLIRYLRNTPNILNEQDPSTGRAPLATAAVAGYPDVVEQLLEKGAKADALSRNGETALLLVTRETTKNRPRIVQLLLRKTPARLIDATTATADSNNTPLMYSVRNKDVESIRLLVKAGASPTAPNNSGVTPEAAAASDKVIARALDPERERAAFDQLTDMVGGFLLYIVAWVNETADGIMDELFKLNPTLDEKIDEEVNEGYTSDKVTFLENVDEFLARDENAVLSRFFKDDPNYIQDLAKNATELAKDPTTTLGSPELLPKVIELNLRQQVIYCDDSSSMQRDGRWNAQVKLVKKIARITTRVLPQGGGVSLRFINQNPRNLDDLGFQEIGDIVENMSWKSRGNTEIGTYLRARILEPMIFSKLRTRTLAKPYLISVMTDGMPTQEKSDTFVEAIKECGSKLVQAGYPRQCVKFFVGQIGSGKSAARFLESVGSNQEIQDMVFVTTDQLDERLHVFANTEDKLDDWLVKLLYEPIKRS